MNLFNFSKPSKQKNTTAVVFSISGMHCVACSLNIEGELEDTPGIHSASANYARAVCTVEYDPSLVNESQIIAIVKKLGYELLPLSSRGH